VGIFITFEGGEGCGKSFQSKALYCKLNGLGIPVELTYEPGGTDLGNEIRRLLKRKRQGIVSSEAELFLFAASRAQLMAEVIFPSLQKGNVVICDRFADSTIAYQGYGRGVDLETVNTLNRIVTQEIKPDLTILLDMQVEKGLNRKRANKEDRFEGEGLAFHNRVRSGYLQLALEEPNRWLVVDATLSRVTISKIIWSKVTQLVPSK